MRDSRGEGGRKGDIYTPEIGKGTFRHEEGGDKERVRRFRNEKITMLCLVLTRIIDLLSK